MTENTQRTTEETFIGFRKEPEGLEDFLREKGYETHHPRNEPSSPDKRYRGTDPLTGGYVYVVYQQGKKIPKELLPSKEEGTIEAVVQARVNLGILPGQSDASLQEMRDILVTNLLAAYQDNAFHYEPQSPAKKRTA